MRHFRSCAKINLHLAVVGRRDDGYHSLQTVFQTIDLADEVGIAHRRAVGIELRVEGADLPTDATNLAFRAAQLFLADWAPPGAGVAIELRKRIPAGAGLGGGSANAATVLRALPELFDVQPDRGWMVAAARLLGADVPFFLVGGTAIGTGRGDVVRPLADAPAPAGDLLLLMPEWRLSTAAVFSQLEAPAAPVEAAFDWPPAGAERSDFAAWIGDNGLEQSAFRLRPELAALYTAAVRSGARRVRMSGSGSALIVLYGERGAAEAAARSWTPDIAWKRVETLGRSAWNAACGFEVTRGGA